ncbi:MAG: FAD-dependent oxidoreductase [Bryobacteraceae bacterium]
MTRRTMLASAAGATLASLELGCAARRKSISSIPKVPIHSLPPVACSPERVIRTVAGLRPFRPSGFVVRTDRIENKVIIHNYGHGGAGITLSSGTAQLALEEAERSGHTEFAVLGCGVVGLSTARLFQRRGSAVTIYTKDMPPNTTSNIAAGWWAPDFLFEPGRQGSSFSAQYVRAAKIAHRYYQNLTNDYYGIRWLPMYALSNGAEREPSKQGPFPEIDELFIDSRNLLRDEDPFPVVRAERFWSMLIEPPIYLNALLRDYLLAGGKIVIREFQNMQAVLALKDPAIVNCTGLGTKTLFGDPELTPVKGQLSVLLPQPEIAYCTFGPGDLYMFPRRDGILLGGTHERGVSNLEPDPVQAARIVNQHADLFRRMRSS